MSDSLSHSCPTCGGLGFEVVEHIDVRAEHHPECSGACDGRCPIPVPEPRYEREPCPNPDCVEGYPKDRIERAVRAWEQEFPCVCGVVDVSGMRFGLPSFTWAEMP